MILYEGPSLINGTPIVVIATKDWNPKVGYALFTWILKQDESPEQAALHGRDEAICGSCKFRVQVPGDSKTRLCYTRLSPSEGADETLPPSEVWKRYKKDRSMLNPPNEDWGQAQDHGLWNYLGPLHVRIGSYGDPAAVPFRVWTELVRYVPKLQHTGFTHLWQQCDPRLKTLCMASTDTPEERAEAQALGWRTFTVTPELHSNIPNVTVQRDVLCPATDASKGKACPSCRDAEGRWDCTECRGKGRIPITCSTCGLCAGTLVPAPSIWEKVHGKNKDNFKWS